MGRRATVEQMPKNIEGKGKIGEDLA